MKQLFKFLAALATSMALIGAAHAGDHAKPEDAQAMLAKAVAYLKANGKDKAIAEFSKKDGPFVDRDLYVTAYDFEGHTLAHVNPRMIGKDNMKLQDADGKFLIKERLDIAKAQGRGQQEYRFLNPTSKQIEPKVMYFEKIGDIVVACGSYKPV